MKKLLAGILALVLSITTFATPVSAMSTSETFAAETVILTGCQDNGNGEGIYCILRLVVDILSVAIGALGVLGIVITGVQYVTAGGSEEKVKKAKRRLIEIIIGLVAYVIGYAVFSWLIPNFNTEQISSINISLIV